MWRSQRGHRRHSETWSILTVSVTSILGCGGTPSQQIVIHQDTSAEPTAQTEAEPMDGEPTTEPAPPAVAATPPVVAAIETEEPGASEPPPMAISFEHGTPFIEARRACEEAGGQWIERASEAGEMSRIPQGARRPPRRTRYQWEFLCSGLPPEAQASGEAITVFLCHIARGRLRDSFRGFLRRATVCGLRWPGGCRLAGCPPGEEPRLR
jgi:hypothetical protein